MNDLFYFKLTIFHHKFTFKLVNGSNYKHIPEIKFFPILFLLISLNKEKIPNKEPLKL